MLNSLKSSSKVIVKELAVAFFFTAIVVIIVNFCLQDKFLPYVKMFNKYAVAPTNTTTNNETSKLDSETKRLTNMPAYGDVFGTIKISSLDIELNLYNGDSLSILKKGVGRYIGSFFPGEGLPIIIAAHNQVNFFYNLYKIENGASIEITTYYGSYTYKVTNTSIMTESSLNDEFNTFLEDDDEETLLLYTCYPSGGIGYRYQRFVVFATLESD